MFFVTCSCYSVRYLNILLIPSIFLMEQTITHVGGVVNTVFIKLALIYYGITHVLLNFTREVIGVEYYCIIVGVVKLS